MANLKSTRGAQWPLMAEFTFDVSTAANDSMPTTVGNVLAGAAPAYNAAVVALGSVGASFYDAIQLPPNAVIVGGDIVVETAVVGPTVSTLSLGDAALGTRYLTTVNLLVAARTALTLTGFVTLGDNLRFSINNTVAVATAGKVTVRVLYTIRGRNNEAQPN